jgi:glyoxylase-like metal-dependent hydrolase (beta-lactamase superfamily II)
LTHVGDLMELKILGFVVGELGSHVSDVLLGISPSMPEFPILRNESKLPYGYSETISWPDGTVSPGVKQPVTVWFIKGAKEKILVDTGFGFNDIELIKRIEGIYCRKKKNWTIEAGLSRIGLKPEDIDIVIHTHLHFDHFLCDEQFSNAIFIVQRDEIPWALAPPPYSRGYKKEFSEHILAVIDRIEALDGDKVITEGVEVWKYGGHSPGSMAIAVETDAGIVALAGDLIYDYKNLELNWPPGLYWNLDELIKAYNSLQKRVDILVPNHDWQFFSLYPSGEIPK